MLLKTNPWAASWCFFSALVSYLLRRGWWFWSPFALRCAQINLSAVERDVNNWAHTYPDQGCYFWSRLPHRTLLKKGGRRKSRSEKFQEKKREKWQRNFSGILSLFLISLSSKWSPSDVINTHPSFPAAAAAHAAVSTASATVCWGCCACRWILEGSAAAVCRDVANYCIRWAVWGSHLWYVYLCARTRVWERQRD